VRAGCGSLGDISVQVVYSESPKQRRAHPPSAGGTEGPLTTRIQRQGSLAPVEILASLKIYGRTHDVQLKYLGLREAWMVGENLPGKKGEKVTLTFPVRTRNGEVNVSCASEVLAIELVNQDLLSTLKLVIMACDEGPQKGIFYDYVRWLHFNAIRSN